MSTVRNLVEAEENGQNANQTAGRGHYRRGFIKIYQVLDKHLNNKKYSAAHTPSHKRRQRFAYLVKRKAFFMNMSRSATMSANSKGFHYSISHVQHSNSQKFAGAFYKDFVVQRSK